MPAESPRAEFKPVYWSSYLKLVGFGWTGLKLCCEGGESCCEAAGAGLQLGRRDSWRPRDTPSHLCLLPTWTPMGQKGTGEAVGHLGAPTSRWLVDLGTWWWQGLPLHPWASGSARCLQTITQPGTTAMRQRRRSPWAGPALGRVD